MTTIWGKIARMFGVPTGPLTDLLLTVDRARAMVQEAQIAVRSARAPVHSDAPQVVHLDEAKRHLQLAQQRLDHVMIVHTLDHEDLAA